MDTKKLIERSKKSFELDPDKLGCANDLNPLVAVHSTGRLILEPIWQRPIDSIEGPLYQKYINENPGYNSLFLRQEVAKRLHAASENLPNYFKLILRAGHRPLMVQNQELHAILITYLSHNPNKSQDDALVYARTFIDDPAIKIPSHCCGGAVDVDVFDTKINHLVDFGSSVNEASDISFLHSSKITKKQHANRMILLKAMLEAGFAPSYVEWWHFSYGESVWAYFYAKPQTLYGITEPNL